MKPFLALLILCKTPAERVSAEASDEQQAE